MAIRPYNRFCGADGFLNFIQVAHGFNDDQINACICQRFDLFGERRARFIRLHASVRRNTHAQRTNIASHQHIIFIGCSNRAPGKFHACAIDLD